MYIIKQNKSGKWILIKKGAKRAAKTFSSKAQAVAYAESKGYKYDIAGTNVDNVARAVKKRPTLLIILIIVFLIIIGVIVYLYLSGKLTLIINTITKKDETTEITGGNGSNSGGEGGSSDSHEHEHIEFGTTVHRDVVEDIIYDDFQIHFMTLGNDYAGDSTYIKAGDTDILIDAGSRAGSYSTTSTYINQYCTDKKFEYVIATHGDQDHIAGFPKFFQNYGVDVCIDFTTETYAKYQEFKETGAKTRSYFAATTKTTATYASYLQARDQYAKVHYSAGDCFKNQNGAKAQYQLSEYVTMTILYNYYYFDNNNDGIVDTTDENNFSVCTLFTYTKNNESQHFLLTGDLELEGEEKMAEYYDGSTTEKTLPEVELFKAGHHGSKTSSNDCLLNIIKPKMCVVCCCCGTDEYTGNTDNQFPTQAFINRVSKWTSRVYVTSMLNSYTIETAIADSKGNSNKTGVSIGGQYISSIGYKDMNGNVCVSCNGNNVGLKATNNLIKLKDSEWFNSTITLDGVSRKMRTWPSDGVD